jgi:hypothetical protein
MDQFTPPTPHKTSTLPLILALILVMVICFVVGVWWFAGRHTNNSANKKANTNTVTVGGASMISIESFKTLVRPANCAQTRNELYVIDDKMVFWLRQGNCPDNSYAYTLYARNPQQPLCVQKDSIAGPDTSCVDDNYAALFNTITGNLNDIKLGLDAGHSVEKIQ